MQYTVNIPVFENVNLFSISVTISLTQQKNKDKTLDMNRTQIEKSTLTNFTTIY